MRPEKHSRARLIALLLVALAPVHALYAQAPQSDSAAVVATVQRLFDGMSRSDTAMLRSVLVAGMQFVSLIADQPAAAKPRIQNDTMFIRTIGSGRQRYLERMWNPVVRVEGAIATLWTRYDFHLDGKWSHCGVDTATLLRTSEGWRIAGLVYTVERTGCPASPLKPPV